MSKTVSIYTISGNILQKIKYIDFNDLSHQLKLLIIRYDSDSFSTLLINENVINNFDIIDMILLSQLNDYDIITIVFSQKKELYCLSNNNGKYILNNKYKDNYSKILKTIIKDFEDNSYDIIINNSYENLVLMAVSYDGSILKYVSFDLQNNEEIVYTAVSDYGRALKYANTDLQNNKEIVLNCIRQDAFAIIYASIDLQNDKEFILECIQQNEYILQVIFFNVIVNKDILQNDITKFKNDITKFKNDKEIVLKGVKQNGLFLQFTNIELQYDKEIVLEAVKQNGLSLEYVNENFRSNKEIVLEAVKQNIVALKFASISLKNNKDINQLLHDKYI